MTSHTEFRQLSGCGEGSGSVGTWTVEWVETYNYGRFRECGVAAASRTGTYGFCEMKCHGTFVDYLQHGNVPVLQYHQARHNLQSFSGCRTAMNNANTASEREYHQISGRGGDELTPGSASGPSVVDLRNSQNLKPRAKNAGVPDLVSEGQEVVVNPQPVHGNRKQLGGFVHDLTFASSPDGSGIRKITLVDSLEGSIGSGTFGGKTEGREHVQPLSDLGHHRKLRWIHLTR